MNARATPRRAKPLGSLVWSTGASDDMAPLGRGQKVGTLYHTLPQVARDRLRCGCHGQSQPGPVRLASRGQRGTMSACIPSDGRRALEGHHTQRTTKLELRGITKRFRVDGRLVVALEDVSLALREGEFVTLVGPSGCGKSTLLNIACGLLQPDQGEILLDGEPAPERLGRLAYMP
ncbi:MAG: ATP-binding cassette domain-containing protein, partial [Anaerolineae bacterium]|nr:ATP-binding cassette domain-containing protein [Anaerolineae bacterium]